MGVRSGLGNEKHVLSVWNKLHFVSCIRTWEKLVLKNGMCSSVYLLCMCGYPWLPSNPKEEVWRWKIDNCCLTPSQPRRSYQGDSEDEEMYTAQTHGQRAWQRGYLSLLLSRFAPFACLSVVNCKLITKLKRACGTEGELWFYRRTKWWGGSWMLV